MTVIRQDDFIASVADALQYISYYHPPDFIRALGEAYRREKSPAARDAMAQILVNSRMCAEGRRPICQDTGLVVVFLKIGMNVRWDADMSVTDMVDEGVRRAYRDADNLLRASMVSDPAGARRNTGDNTPAIVHMEVVPGDQVEVTVAAKGGGSENKAIFATLNPSDDIVEWVLKTVPSMGAGWCPPGMLGIGIGGSAEKAMLLAKESSDGADRHPRPQGARSPEPRRGIADRHPRPSQRARHRRPGAGWPDDCPGREDQGLPHPRRLPAGRDDSQLRRDAPHPFHPGRAGAGSSSAGRSRPVARGASRSAGDGPARRSRQADAGAGGGMEGRGAASAEWHAADRPRCRA